MGNENKGGHNDKGPSDEPSDERIEITRAKLDEYDARIRDAENLAKRMKADFENFRKSVERDKERLSENICIGFVERLLPILDTFEQAMLNTKSEAERKGLGLVYAQLIEVLNKYGLRPIDALGKEFDPYKHEIIMRECSAMDDDIIIEEFQKGYMINDKVLRHSKVKVSCNAEDSQKQNDDDTYDKYEENEKQDAEGDGHE